MDIQEAKLIFDQYGYLALFLGSIIGLGDPLLILIVVLSFTKTINIFLAFGIWLAGVLVGDCFIWYILGFFLGKKIVKRFLERKKSVLNKIKKYFKKYGSKTIFIVRFVYGLRIPTFIIAGLSKMKIWKFLIYDILGISCWGILIFFLGYFLGYSWFTSESSSKIYQLIFIGVVLIIGLGIYKTVIYKKSLKKDDY